jgi:hypothetical protein
LYKLYNLRFSDSILYSYALLHCVVRKVGTNVSN